MKKHQLVVGLAVSALTVAGAVAPATASTPAAVTTLAAAAPPSLTYTPAPGWWSTNGRVNDIKVVGGRVYLAGGFDYIGPTTGHGVAVSRADGTAVASFPKIDGIVRAAVQDGRGGWYLGGDFAKVGFRVRGNVAHVLADGTVDATFGPKVQGGTVNALALTPTGLVLGGTFTGIDSVAATRLAKVDAATGARITWNASANNTVRALASADGKVYVGGDFTTLSGSSRSRLGRVSEATGVIDTTFAGSAGGVVRALAVDTTNARLVAAGDFTTAAGGSSSTARQRVAAYALSNGALSPFTANANASVQALAVGPTGQLYLGGLFTTIGSAARSWLAEVSPAGVVGPLVGSFSECNAPHSTKYAHGMVPCTPEVSALTVDSGVLYVGGRFGRSGGEPRHDAAAFSLDTGALTPWNPVASDRPLVISAGAAGGPVFVGGELVSVNGLVRKGIAALDAQTGAGITTFNADTDEFVEAMVPSTDGSRLFLAGQFTTVQGQGRPSVASIVTATGLVDPAFRPAFNKGALTLAYAQGSLWVGGKFTKVSSVARARAVKLDAATGAVDPAWVANTSGPSGALRANGMVQGMEVTPDGSTVFMGGPFSTVNGTTVPGGLAVVSGTTGALGPKQLGGVQGCGSVGPWINRLYLSDDGRRLYGGDICPDYVYQWDAVNLSSATNPTGLNWRNLCNGGMQGRLEVNGHFYYGTHGGDKGSGGRCQAYPGGPNVSQQRYFVFDAATGTLQPDAPQFDTAMGVWAFAATDAGLLVGGDFTFAGNRNNVQQGLAFFPGTP